MNTDGEQVKHKHKHGHEHEHEHEGVSQTSRALRTHALANQPR